MAFLNKCLGTAPAVCALQAKEKRGDNEEKTNLSIFEPERKCDN